MRVFAPQAPSQTWNEYVAEQMALLGETHEAPDFDNHSQ